MSKLVSLMHHIMGIDASTGRRLDAELLEDRILMNASPLAGVVVALDESLQNVDGVDPSLPPPAPVSSSQPTSSPDAAGTANIHTATPANVSTIKKLELVFIDPATANYQQLVDDLLAGANPEREFEVYVLENSSDGGQQISDILAGYADVDAIHLVSHGDNGAIRLGNGWLNAANLNAHAGQLALWQSSLTADADILIYGCDLASSPTGVELVESLSALTGADVAASANDTGHVSLGADWLFEYYVGTVETDVAFSQQLQDAWTGKLSSITVTTTLDIFNTVDTVISLREAVIQANASAGDDTIFLGAGTYTLTISGGDDASLMGDLDITDLSRLTIVGDGASTTTINVVWNNIAVPDRVFSVLSGATLSLQGLTIQGGDATTGAGGAIYSEGTLELDHVNISGGRAAQGAGIYSTGTLAFVDGEVFSSGTSATTMGGGIYIAAGSNATLTRVNLYQNQAQAGAGLYNAGSLTYVDGNVSQNGTGASSTGGGIHNHYLGTANLNRVTIDGNQSSASAGIFNDSNIPSFESGSMTLTNVTISGNSSVGTGGLYNKGNLQIQNSTIANNSGSLVGGIRNEGFVSIANSIIADNNSTTTNEDVAGIFVSLGFNLVEEFTGSSGWTADDLLGIDPALGVLSNNGGIAATHRLLEASIAIDAGSTTGAPAVDARGYTRDAAVDMGAFEYRDPVFTDANLVAVNTSTTGVQGTIGQHRGSQQAVAIDGDGNYVVVWTSDSQDSTGTNVFARRFRSDGTALTSEIRVNDQTVGDQKWARVASDESGNFVVTWTSVGQDSIDGSQGVYARRFSAAGHALSNEFQVSTTFLGDQSNSTIAMNSAGYFAIVWEGNGTGHAQGIFGRRYTPLGISMDATEILISSDIINNHFDPTVAMNFAGAMVVTWENSVGVRARVFDELGVSIIPEFGIGTSSTATNPVVAMNDNGSFVVAWDDPALDSAVYLQTFLPGPTHGTLVPGSIQQVNSTSIFAQNSPSISMDREGNFIVVWEGNGTQSGNSDSSGIFGQRYASDGDRIGDEFLINSQTSGVQKQASISLLDMNDFVVVWSGEGLGDTNGVFARQFGNSAPTIISNSGGSSATLSIVEGTTAVTTVVAIDSDYPVQVLEYSLSGVDASFFTINSNTGAISFLIPPNTQSPMDSGGDNVYDIVVQASDGILSDTQNIAVTVLHINQAPTISVPGAQTISQGNTLTFSGILGNAIVVSDLEAGNVQVSLLATNGTISLASNFSTLGLSFVTGDGNSDTSVQFQGTLASVNAALDGMTFSPTSAYAGTAGLQITVNDLGNSGSGGPLSDTELIAITVLPVNSGAVWMSMAGPGVATGGVTWTNGSVLSVGDPSFDLEPGTTTGTFSPVFNINSFGTNGGHTVSALHLVATTITVGGNGNSFTLLPGDLLFSIYGTGNKTIDGINFNSKDLMVFRPSTAGNYASGTFTKLLDDPSGIFDIREIALVENPMGVTIGNTMVSHGDFLLVHSGGSIHDNIYVFRANEVGAGTTVVTSPMLLLEGSDLGIDQHLAGLELIQTPLQAGGLGFTAGQLLLSVRGSDTVGGVSVTPYDVFSVTLTQAGANTVGTVSLVAEGTDVDLTSSGEEIRGLTLAVSNVAPLLYGANVIPSITEDPVSNMGVSISFLAAGQFYDTDGSFEIGVAITAADNSHGTWQYSSNSGTDWTDVGSVSTSQARLLPANATTRIRFVPQANWNGSSTLAFRAWDETSGNPFSLASTTTNGGQSAFSTNVATTSITVTPVNDAPTITNHSSQPSHQFNLAENTSLAITMTANDVDTPAQNLQFRIIGGTEANWFNLDASSGKLTFKSTPDFEQPNDAGQDREYEVIIEVSDGLLIDSQALTISITDANDPPIGVAEAYTLTEDGSLTAYGNWFDPNWSTFQEIKFNNTSTSNLVDHVILVTLDASKIDYTKTQDAGQDLRFVDADGTLLDYEIEVWDEAGVSQVWVRVPQIDASSSTDSIRMYYGNTSATAGENATGVWASGTQAVIHMDSSPGDSTVHSTIVSYNGTTSSAGKVGEARSFDGTDDDVNLGSSSAVDDLFTGGGTITAWINPKGWGENGFGRIADKSSGTGSGWSLFVYGMGDNGGLVFEFGFSDQIGRWSTLPGTLTTGAWQSVTVVYNSSSTSSNPQIYINGTLATLIETSSPQGSALSDASRTLKLGSFSGGPTRTFEGAIDEFRAYNHALSANQVHAQFLAVNGGLTSIGPAKTTPGVLANDIDQDGSPLTAALVAGPSHGSLNFNSSGAFVYTPSPNYFGSDQFTYTASDGTNTSTTVTVSLIVQPVNDAPVISSNGGGTVGSITIAENNSVPMILTANEFDGDSVEYSITGGTDASKFTLDKLTGKLTFLSTAADYEAFGDSDKNNVYEVQVTVTDATGLSDSQTLIIQVTDQNEFAVSPIGDMDLTANQVSENAATGTGVGIRAFAIDADGTNSMITYSLADNAGGRFFIDSSTGIVRVADGSRIDRETASTYAITVMASSTDGSTSLRTFNIDVLPVNEFAPFFTSSLSQSVNENQAFVTQLTASDDDLPTPGLTYAIIGGVDRAKFKILADNSLVFVSPPNFENPGDSNRDNVYEVLIGVHDGSGKFATATFTVSVNNVNDSPTARDHSFTVLLGGSFTVAAPGVLLGATDEDSAFLTASLLSPHSRVTLASDGSFVYTPSESIGQDGFTYLVSDGQGGFASGTVFITVATIQQPIVTTPPTSAPSTTTVPVSTTPPSTTPPPANPPAGNADSTPVVQPTTQITTIQIADTPAQSSSVAAVTNRELSALADTRVTENIQRVQKLTERLVESNYQQERRAYREAERQESIRAIESINSMNFQHDTFNAMTDIVWQDIESIQNQIDVIPSIDPVVMGAATGLTSTLSVGYVVWLVRGGYIVAGVMTQLPAWRIVDPLPILNQLDDPEYDDDDSLESMVTSSDAQNEHALENESIDEEHATEEAASHTYLVATQT